MTTQWKKWCIGLFLLPIGTFGQENLQNTVAALRNDVIRLADAYRNAVNRINELEEALIQQQKANANRDTRSEIKELETRIQRLEALVNEQNRLLRAELSQESKIRQAAINKLAQEVSKEFKGIQGKNRASGQVKISKGYELREIVVAQGDTLSELAQIAQTSVEEIKRINQMKNDTIHVGQKLKVPVKK